jgi:hypothetical protein
VCVALGLFNHLTIYQFNTAKRSNLKKWHYITIYQFLRMCISSC